MMKKLKKAIAIITIIASVLSLGACGEKKETVSDGKNLSYWVSIPNNQAALISTFNDVNMYKKREKDTGIHIDFTHVSNDIASEQFKLMIVSGDLPDIVEHNWTSYTGGVQKAIDEDVLIPLNDYKDIIPNFMKALTEGEYADSFRKGSTTDDGYIYGFTGLQAGSYRIYGGPLIRRDILKKDGKEIPETIAEWEELLTFYKNEKGMEAPLTGSKVSHFKPFVGAFGTSDTWFIDDDGKVQYGPAQPQYKDFLAKMHEWYEKGLVDRNISTNTGDLTDAKFLTGEVVAVTSGNIGGDMGRFLKQKLKEDPNFDIVGVPFPVLNKGEINKYAISTASDITKTRTAGVTTSCKTPEVAMKWLDWLYSEEGFYTTNFGVEGEDWNMIDGKPVYVDRIKNNPEGRSMVEGFMLCCRANEPFAGFLSSELQLEQYYEYPQQVETLELWGANTEAVRKTSLPVLHNKDDEADKISSISSDLTTYTSEMYWAFITGKEPIENFDKYIENLNNKFKLNEFREIRQTQYKRYLER